MFVRFFLLYVFFFKQKTAYEMRISDWSSDVCSSDLSVPCRRAWPGTWRGPPRPSARRPSRRSRGAPPRRRSRRRAAPRDRTSVVLGKSVSVRVDLGGLRLIQKKNRQIHTTL